MYARRREFSISDMFSNILIFISNSDFYEFFYQNPHAARLHYKKIDFFVNLLFIYFQIFNMPILYKIYFTNFFLNKIKKFFILLFLNF